MYQEKGKMYCQKEVSIGKLEKGYIIIMRTKNKPEPPDEDVYITLDEVLDRTKQFLKE